MLVLRLPSAICNMESTRIWRVGKEVSRGCFADARGGYGVKMTDGVGEKSQGKYDEGPGCTNLDLSNDAV